MPSAVVESHGIPAVETFGTFLDDLLKRAEAVKPAGTIDPPLDKSHFKQLLPQLADVLGPDLNAGASLSDLLKGQRNALIETAVRDTFSNLIATKSIDSPDFAKVWNLFDVLCILSDSEQCDPALLFWLIEELLDSQTIAGCRKVFDFLESRRERITAKHFKQKQLIILRTCNELLRRLSRALDPAFCGRVFIFLFQSFPLGDKSSINLRGEYHVENVTTFDTKPLAAEGGAEKMDVDVETPSESQHRGSDQRSSSRSAILDGRKQQHPEKASEKALDPDVLYPIFWHLQESFNQPKKLFDVAHFTTFKAGLESTLATFRSIKPEQGSRSKDKQEKQADDGKRTLKRKRDNADDDLATAFNPKYLTSRDLFSLEISDLAFRRNVLVQALIVMEFLLSLSQKAKSKLVGVTNQNKAVMYSEHVLSEEDTKWVTDVKDMIATYLKMGQEGPYFFRMVETVLSRDKNWVRWKIENCPPIERPPISPETFVEARSAASKMATVRRMRPMPVGSLPLDFLDDGDEVSAMDKFKATDRYELPDLMTFRKKIADDDFEIEMPTNSDTKAAAVESKASKTWRALRIASKYKLAAFDKIDSDDKIDAIFEETPTLETEEETADVPNGDAVFPDDRRPIVLVAAPSKPSLAEQLISQYPGTFSRAPSHITRKPLDGEKNGRDFHFVDQQAFNVMRDGDQFLEFSEGDVCRGTSRRVVETITETGKVALLELDSDGAQQVKDFGYSARFILVSPPSANTLESQLRDSGGLSDIQIQEAVKAAAKISKHASSATTYFYDSTVADIKLLGAVIFGSGRVGDGSATGDKDATMDG
ncbi:THO complex subunit 1 transcription elongation factor-domain-containing protein [Bombardia bombarda]|uniref:THO complex subunit 1 transcription elongation factor-domain-containing protein n=1 Tax=Bombardia bombarda TaxID=252184 RepID=A0AA40CFV4_9PEZI|nr:THO complex subunit 1 transcription elongation factor-domain-containing protein [Bombardia bombarda]